MPSKWLRTLQEKHHSEHMERIRNMRPVVDAGPPRELPLSGKKEIERRRFLERVEKSNRELLDRLGKAMEKKNIDNERHDKIKFQSLQAGLKKVELARVTTENHMLLSRIQSAIPEYDHHAWERDAVHREFYLKNMTEYPEAYVPHHPPLRKKFLAEQAAALAAKRQSRGGQRKFGAIAPPEEEPIVEGGRPLSTSAVA